MNRNGRITLALSMLLTVVAAGAAGDTPSQSQDEEAIWKLEQWIYSGGSGGGNLANYLQTMDADYAGWPPQTAAPVGYAHIAEAARTSSRASVELTLARDLVRVHRDGNVALAFYTTHRAARAGAAVGDSFETLHVWIKDKDGAWRLFGAFVRPAPAARAAAEEAGPPPVAK